MGGRYEVKSRISDSELVEGYLRAKVKGEATANPRFIVENMGEELYTREPWLLPQPTDPMLNPGEWFYLGKRNPRYLYAEGVDCVGAWKYISGRLPIVSEESGEVIGVTMRFEYYCRDKNDDDSFWSWSNWYMREYRLCDKFIKAYDTPHVLGKITWSP